jgi:hypothetical protein
LIKT